MTEELKETHPPVEARQQKSAQELLAESKERTDVYEGSQVAQRGFQTVSAFANNEQAWNGVAPAEPRLEETERARHSWTLQEQRRVLDSGGRLVIERGHIKHQSLLPDDYGFKVPEMAYEFDGTGFSAQLGLDAEGNATRTLLYEVPKDSTQPRKIELFTRDGSMKAVSGTPEFEQLQKELFIEVGKGLRPDPNPHRLMGEEEMHQAAVEAGDKAFEQSVQADIDALPGQENYESNQ